jgi:HEAT repeat protein
MISLLTEVVLALGALVAALLVVIVTIRAAAIHRKAREDRLRPATELALADYLAGVTGLPSVTGAGERAVFADMALDALADLRGGERERLVNLLVEGGYVADAASRLRTGRQTARRRAAETLATVAADAAVPALVSGLTDSDVLVRTTCARALAEAGPADAVPAIADIANRDGPAAPGAVAGVVLALGQHRPDALGPLLRRDSRRDVRAIALRVAGELRLSQHSSLLRACLADGDDLAALAARGLGRIGEINAVGDLARIALDPARGSATRAAAVTALGSIGDPAATGVLERELDRGDWTVLAAAVQALTGLGDPGTAALRRASRSPRPSVKALAEAVLRP